MLPKLSSSPIPCRVPGRVLRDNAALTAVGSARCKLPKWFILQNAHFFFSCLVLGLHSYLEENHYRSQNTEPGPHESFNPAFHEEWVQSHSYGPPQCGKTIPPSRVGQRRSQKKRPCGLPSFPKSLFTYIPMWPALLMSPLKCKQIVSTIRLLLMLFHPL